MWTSAVDLTVVSAAPLAPPPNGGLADDDDSTDSPFPEDAAAAAAAGAAPPVAAEAAPATTSAALPASLLALLRNMAGFGRDLLRTSSMAVMPSCHGTTQTNGKTHAPCTMQRDADDG